MTPSRAKNICKVGCIRCGACVKAVGELFELKSDLTEVDYDNSSNTDPTPAAAKCPTKVIIPVDARAGRLPDAPRNRPELSFVSDHQKYCAGLLGWILDAMWHIGRVISRVADIKYFVLFRRTDLYLSLGHHNQLASLPEVSL